MPVKRLASHPDLSQLKFQAKDLLKALAAQDRGAAQRVREFHPRLQKKTDAEIFAGQLRLSDAQLTIARECGFASWAVLKRHIESPRAVATGELSFYQRIEDATFLQGVKLIDSGNVVALRALLHEHPALVHQHIRFEGRNYFRNPTLLEFVAENPIRRDTLPENIVEVAKVILDAGAKEDIAAVNETLMLVCSGKVPREQKQQLPLIHLLCSYGADPDPAMLATLVNGEFTAVDGLIAHGARFDLGVAAATGHLEKARELVPHASGQDRHRALALASQFGHTEVVKLLLEVGENPDRYNPVGTHSHSTPLHQAALAGHLDVVRLLVEGGASLDLTDLLYNGTPSDWARHAGNSEVESYLVGEQQKPGSRKRN